MRRLTRLMAEVFRLDENEIVSNLAIHQAATWNSLTHMELVVSIEEAFQIQLTEDEIAAMTSVAEIEKVLKSRDVLMAD